MSKAQIAQSLTQGTPIVLVGNDDPLREAASEMGLRTIECAIDDVDGTLIVKRTDIDLLVVSGCEGIWTDGDEQAALDLLFDGHPHLPAHAVVALRFSTPNEMSESLADDAIPCAFFGIDAGTAIHAEPPRIAA